MEVRRLDLGADVVHVPSRDLLVIHPDLDYAEALGAVLGTLPGLHPDVAVELVEQVTPRPHPEPRHRPRRAVRALAALAVAAIMVLVVNGASTAAAAPFGETWRQQMALMGMTCERAENSTTTCTAEDQTITRVEGFRRHHASLYIIDRPDLRPSTYLLIFDDQTRANRYAHSHPEVSMAGRVAVW